VHVDQVVIPNNSKDIQVKGSICSMTSRVISNGCHGGNLTLSACPRKPYRIANRGRRLGGTSLQFVFSPKDFPGPLPDDDAGSHGIAGRHARHDGAIGDTKILYAVNPEAIVYN
jgi:hypothetical protein